MATDMVKSSQSSVVAVLGKWLQVMVPARSKASENNMKIMTLAPVFMAFYRFWIWKARNLLEMDGFFMSRNLLEMVKFTRHHSMRTAI